MTNALEIPGNQNGSPKLTNKQFAQSLELRTKKFAIEIIKLSSTLKDNPASRVISYQLLKAATSVGANYREANRPVSRADFKSKISICVKEAAETQYWLELIKESNLMNDEHADVLHKECSELLALFSSIYKGCLERK